MKYWSNFLKISVFIIVVAMSIAGCEKENNVTPYYTPEREVSLIKAWLDSVVAKNIDLDTTSTGILYIPGKIGTGSKVKAGDAVTVKYTGRLLDGTIFDASAWQNEAGTMAYVHKTNRMIQGWEEGIEVLSKGGSAAFLIPSYKGYGSKGKGASIPPYTPLFFVIEVVNIK